MIGGFLTKILGMIIKIVISRMIGTEGLGMYMLILPSFMLFIYLGQLGLPLALSKLIAEDNKNNKNLFFSILPLLLLINIFLMLFIILIAPFIGNTLLHNKDATFSIMAISFTIPFTSISSICRSYFFGKQKMTPHILSIILEDIVRLGIIFFFLPKVMPYGLKIVVCFLVLSNVFSELSSIFVLLFFLPKNIKITKKDLIPNKTYLKESLSIGLPSTTGRLIGTIGFFLEPIVLTNSLLNNGYSLTYITREYGIISGYVMPLILLPSFFSLAISQALLPVIAKEYSLKNYKTIFKRMNLAIIFSLGIGIPVSILLLINPAFFLSLIYHTREGISYIKVLAPICLLEYLQAPLSSCLDGIGKTKDNMKASIIGMSTRTILLFLFSFLKIGIWSYILSLSFNILFTTLYQILKVKKYLH